MGCRGLPWDTVAPADTSLTPGAKRTAWTAGLAALKLRASDVAPGLQTRPLAAPSAFHQSPASLPLSSSAGQSLINL